ncbi:MAG: M23 family metallopeptidase, partial [Candidatus Marinimicrobia bacterium]|nr:M23 family metallopeptidase [Candidatus Neomarinimicrobiota bacterium]
MDISHSALGFPDAKFPQTRVLAAFDGKIHMLRDGEEDHYAEGNSTTERGNFIMIDHDPDGTLDLENKAGYRYTVYSLLKKNSIRVQEGDHVKQGQWIGVVGNSGKSGSSTGTSGTRLHFEVRGGYDIDQVDPYYSPNGKGSNTTQSMWADQCGLPSQNFWNADGSSSGGLPVPQKFPCHKKTSASTTTSGSTTTTSVFGGGTATTAASVQSNPKLSAIVGGLIWPVKEGNDPLKWLSFPSPNWYGNPRHSKANHWGTDIGHASSGQDLPDAEIVAAFDGKVFAVRDGEEDNENDPQTIRGNFITIDHDPDGELDLENKAGYRYTSYCLLKKDSVTVKEGDTVKQGDKIAMMGNSGGGTTYAGSLGCGTSEPHLHFEVRGGYDVDQVDPYYSEDGSGSNTQWSMWADQCSLPSQNFFPKNGTGQGGKPVPPECPEVTSADYVNPDFFYPDAEIVAAFEGRVVRVVDGEPDRCVHGPKGWNFDTEECGGGCAGSNCGGNYVVIDHDPGADWDSHRSPRLNLLNKVGYRYTSYSHMKKGSITVKVGDRVQQGQKIGMMGSSGQSNGPHLHFGCWKKFSFASGPWGGLKEPVDPYYSPGGHGSNTEGSMWEDQCNLPSQSYYPKDGKDPHPSHGYGGGLPVPPECEALTVAGQVEEDLDATLTTIATVEAKPAPINVARGNTNNNL